MKKCKQCLLDKPKIEFNIKRRLCDQCRSLNSRLNSKKNRNSEFQKQYILKNRDKLIQYKKDYYLKNKEKIQAKNREYRKTEKAIALIKKFNEIYKLTGKKKIADKKSYLKNREKRRESSAIYRKKLNYKDIYNKQKSNIIHTLRCLLRTRINTAIKSNTKTGSAVRDLGCTIPELKSYLESKFKPGMTWDNWSRTGWHIDHIIPLSTFNLQDPEEFKKAVHYTNLQPLWASENLSKGNKILNTDKETKKETK